MSIECPKYQIKNPDDSKFCKECATLLPGIQDDYHTKILETPVKRLTRGSVFAGRYEIIEELGKGGMGKVYRVLDKELKPNNIMIDKAGNARIMDFGIARTIKSKGINGKYF